MCLEVSTIMIINITNTSLIMSPLSKLIIDLRKKRNLRQKDLANAVGYEQSYISALEVSTKGPPTSEFINKLIKALNLTQEEQVQLKVAIQKSDRKFVIPTNSPEALYELCYELRQTADQVLPSQIEMILKVLRLPNDIKLESNRVLTVQNGSC